MKQKNAAQIGQDILDVCAGQDARTAFEGMALAHGTIIGQNIFRYGGTKAAAIRTLWDLCKASEETINRDWGNPKFEQVQ